MTVVILFMVYCLEAGLFFIIAPWTRFWTVNPLLHLTPAIAVIADNSYVRGFVSGFGLVHLIVGIHEVRLLMRNRKQVSAPSK